MKTETVVAPPAPYQLNFKCYTRTGMTAFAFARQADGTVDEGSLRPLLDEADLKPGMELLFNSGFGGYWIVTVDADRRNATGESVFVSLVFDLGVPEEGIPAEWVGAAFADVKALSRIDFV